MGSRLRGNDAEEEKMSPRNQTIAREGLHGFLAQPDAPTTRKNAPDGISSETSRSAGAV